MRNCNPDPQLWARPFPQLRVSLISWLLISPWFPVLSCTSGKAITADEKRGKKRGWLSWLCRVCVRITVARVCWRRTEGVQGSQSTFFPRSAFLPVGFITATPLRKWCQRIKHATFCHFAHKNKTKVRHWECASVGTLYQPFLLSTVSVTHRGM